MIQHRTVARHQGTLFSAERFGSGVTDIDRWGADIAESFGPSMQTKLHIFQITAVEILGEETNGIEAGAGDVKAKAGAVRYFHDPAGIDGCRDRVDRHHFVISADWIYLVGN